MREKGIQTQIGTYAIHQTPYLKDYRRVGDLTNSINLSNNLLSLPLHYQLTSKDQERVVNELKLTIKSL